MDDCTYKDPRCATTEQCWCTGVPVPPLPTPRPQPGPIDFDAPIWMGREMPDMTTDPATMERVNRELRLAYERLVRTGRI